ncbi:hypothetical protein L6452_42264 [Arctium lappa]|uniref:Uncharacterized protein n=1 Tax=Arctium lappa TaxID=4217 RepID=A0ACB8XJI7_ARCLA|nr:hypothetical protein L6452_42264 [Arctium lappa]
MLENMALDNSESSQVVKSTACLLGITGVLAQVLEENVFRGFLMVSFTNGGCWMDKADNIIACRDTFRGRIKDVLFEPIRKTQDPMFFVKTNEDFWPVDQKSQVLFKSQCRSF